MLEQPYQYRYYKDNDERNFPLDLEKNHFANGEFLSRDETGSIKNGKRILRLGIQTTPGVQFRLNKGDYIEVPETGIYELDLYGIGHIDSVMFNTDNEFWGLSLGDNKKDFFLFVDILYEEAQTQL